MQEASISDKVVSSDIKLSISGNIVDVFSCHSLFRELFQLVYIIKNTRDTTAEKKKEVLEREFRIPMTKKMEGEVEYMCNLSDGVEQRGIEKGIQKGILLTLCDLVRDNIITIEEAAKRANVTIEEFKLELNKQ